MKFEDPTSGEDSSLSICYIQSYLAIQQHSIQWISFSFLSVDIDPDEEFEMHLSLVPVTSMLEQEL